MAKITTSSRADSLRRWAYRNRTLRTTLGRKAWRRKQKQSLTPSEKKKRAAERHTIKKSLNEAIEEAQAEVKMLARGLFERFNIHNERWFYEKLMQKAKSNDNEREVNRWNAYIFKEKKRRLTGEYGSYLAVFDSPPALTEAGEDGPRPKAHELAKELKINWKAMTLEEQRAETEEAVEELKQQREMKKLSVQNVAINAFHDVRANLQVVEHHLDALYARTGTEVLLFAVRSNFEHYARPYTYSTSERVKDFFQMSFDCDVGDYARQFETYCLSGAKGTATNYVQELSELKRLTSKLIFEKFEDVARPDKVSRMHYHNFDAHVTDRLGIVIENWPLKKFCAPGELNSRPELEVLNGAWASGATKFRRLTLQELAAWKQQRHQPPVISLEPIATAANAGAPNVEDSGNPAPLADSIEQSVHSSLPPDDSSLPAAIALPQPLVPSSSTAPLPASNTMHVFSVTSGVIGPTKKPRKERSDKNKKRGPNARSKKKPEQANVSG
ncbi:hypothetical protein PHLCEN_2v4455 [Hermanssonia centrifuga]|uniref:Uncharacterized protein n=1 Tax=Hermanssonia centrifuga TaxID=98765 RepID=A0A2R6PNJ6_9APHY|nr:hypothetical protein PHLCEN_2v4455 [Hermanssonia centrifuga]